MGDMKQDLRIYSGKEAERKNAGRTLGWVAVQTKWTGNDKERGMSPLAFVFSCVLTVSIVAAAWLVFRGF